LKISTQHLSAAVLLGFLACFSLLGLGCSSSSGGAPADNGTAGVTALLLTADGEDIESLSFTVTEISLDYGEEEDEYEPKIVIFSGEKDVDLAELTDVPEVLSCVEVPAGVYTKVRFSIANPRLILSSDPDTVITDIHLTANGRVYISEQFELPDQESYLLILHLESIHLVELGNDGYVLTPQLTVQIEIEPMEGKVWGTIVDIDKDADTFTLGMCEGSEIRILYTDALVFLPGDTDTPTGTEDDLDVGDYVIVSGTVWVDSTLTADSIRVL